MSAPMEAVEQEIERLEDVADEIEELYRELFRDLEGGGRKSRGLHPEVSQRIPESTNETRRAASKKYELWYNSARPLVAEYLPERAPEFKRQYSSIKERLHLDVELDLNAIHLKRNQDKAFDLQRSLLLSIPSKMHIEELKVRKQVSKDVSQGELDKARDLFEEGEVRASGVITGVALERYLLMLCQNSDADIDYNYNDGISALAQKLYEADEIGSSPHGHLKHLATIRANCAHANEVEPDESNVRRLIEDAEDYIRGRKI